MELRPWRRGWRWEVMAKLIGAGSIFLLILWVSSNVSFDWAIGFWEWLTQGESGSSTIRNLGLGILSVPALWVAVMRIRVSYRQVEAIEMGQANDRFQKGAEMLGGELLAVRLGGIYVLDQLARYHPDPFFKLVLSQYCAFVRHPPTAKEGTTKEDRHIRETASHGLREDVQAIMTALAMFGPSGTRNAIESSILDLTGADLRYADLNGADLRYAYANLSDAHLQHADLSGADLRYANLSDAHLQHANLNYARLEHANLSGADLEHADLTLARLEHAKLGRANLKAANLSHARLGNAELGGANLQAANLSDAYLRDVVEVSGPGQFADLQVCGLTQDQLDDACADSQEPPHLDGVVGPDGGSLEWRGGNCEEKNR